MIYIIWIILAILVGILGKDRKIGFGLSFFLSIILSPLIGLIIVLISDKSKKVIKKQKYKEFKELAEKEEYKENYKKAIDLYMDALYHLEHDYKSVSGKSDEKRIVLVDTLKQKVDDLKLKIEA